MVVEVSYYYIYMISADGSAEILPALNTEESENDQKRMKRDR